MGRPVVSTPQGLRGIRQEDRIRENGIFEYSDEDSLVEVLRALRDQSEAERQTMAAAAMQFVERRFSQTAVSQIVRESIKGGMEHEA